MKTEKVIADTMPLALKMVRQKLGDNAIIVNSRTVKTGGLLGLFTKQKFEITAYSMDDEDQAEAESSFQAELRRQKEKLMEKNKTNETVTEKKESQTSGFHKKPQQLYNYYAQKETEPEKPEKLEKPEPPASAVPVEKDDHLLTELQNMRKLMTTMMMDDKKNTGLPPSLIHWLDHLKKQGVNEEVIQHIVTSLLNKYETLSHLQEQTIKEEIFAIVKSIIEKRIPESLEVNEKTRLINLIGPTGVGKTTSIAKLATEQVLKQKRRVAMITTDVYRIAAVEQLKIYSGILNVPIEIVHSADELEAALKKLEHYDLVYMDTTGRNYREAEHREAIDQFLNQPILSDNYLVLSLTTKYEDMEQLLNEFLKSPVKKLILTKFDETGSYGSILNIAFNYPYQLAYITNGQSVPKDITVIDPERIADFLLGEG
ncbi:flagellar biosynthesis protein FlhF [Pullulanibacillus sp. KACC 23026]|uniref:flagellar biosynthesis protein FlhF n=1 Tax=Pullulanibacillus sp. KACC 23026 TaxID=3028315 RepID=UPI0023AF207F|nr:flagellar biosynthesis protein FlhF [Pullulanibacillus sp. KACC 23026]WEG11225.1 flagellar biosynthesis protein FlhF [Pullulanibacillus sp. KACC 23026]